MIGFYLLQVSTLSSVNADIEDRNQTNESINAQIASKQKYATLQTEAAAQEQKLAARVRGRGVVLVAPDGHVTGDPVRHAYLDTLSLQITDPATGG